MPDDSRRPDGEAAVFFRVPVTVEGLVRGRELEGTWELALAEHEIRLWPEGSRAGLAIPWVAVEGVRLASRGDSLTLFLVDGDVVELAGTPRLSAAAREIARHCCALPELMRPLRGLGSHRGQPGAEHDRFFAPLLAARREIERSPELQRRLAAFEGPALRLALRDTLAAFAAERHPRSAPDRRACETALHDHTVGLVRALDAVTAAAARVREGDDETRFARWHEWARAVHAVFDAADRAWLAVMTELGGAAPERPRFWRRLFGRRGTAVVVAAFVLAPIAVKAQDGIRSTWEVSGVRAESLLARGFDVVGTRGERLLVVADEAALERLRLVARVERELVTPRVSALRQGGPAAVAAPVVYRPYDGTRSVSQYLDSIAAANPLVHLDTLGTTYEGRPILAVKIGAADDSPSRPNALYLATYHAREWAATEMALRLIRHLASPPAPSARVDSLVAARDIWVVPVVNPDGYQYTFTAQRLWRKNRRPVATGVFGVDLNRNHSRSWGYDDDGSSPIPGSDIYRGPSPASEAETQAVEAFHAAHPPAVSISYHTYTGLVLYPPGYDYAVLPGDLGVYRALAGTDVRPSVIDRLPSPGRGWYHPAPSWNLYPTNGDYNDWAYAEHGTISFTPELTSGMEGETYYGFEFPDDEAKLQRVFLDNLPFALDVLEAARDPLDYRSPTTGLRAERLAIESVFPVVRALVPAGASDARVVVGGATVPTTTDTAGHGTYTRRLVSAPLAVRPASVTVRAGVLARRWSVLAANGAEPDESGWTAIGFAATNENVPAGTRAWAVQGSGTLRSPIVPVPAATDTLSLVFWTAYLGDGFSLAPHGEVRVSRDGGATWTLAERLSGNAPVPYPVQVRLEGVAGRNVQVEFATADGLYWTLDEIALLAPSTVGGDPPASTRLLASANPVRDATVTLTWPFAEGGQILVYDFAGRLVSRVPVAAGALDATWNVAASGARNGAYVVVARSGGATARLKLFVLR